MRLQLWSWNYDPEPTAMGPIAAIWARGLQERGHQVEVVTAHPHYPGPLWGHRLLPYREVRQGVPVTRLPLWIGHTTTAQRVREELTYMATSAVAMPVLRSPDVLVSVSPAFLALAPMIVNVRLRNIPWLLWLQDLLPDAAETTGLLRNRPALALARALAARAYRAPRRIVVISETFKRCLIEGGVPEEKVRTIYNPATRGLAFTARPATRGPLRVFYMGNIGFSQGLVEIVNAFARTATDREVHLVIAGQGELSSEVAAAASAAQRRIHVLGLVDPEALDGELERASVGLVSQRGDIAEFNLPSKLMTLMARAVPILACVPPQSEVARLITEARAGWVVDSSDPDGVPALASRLADAPEELERCSRAALAFAERHFTPHAFLGQFENALDGVI